ncbi:MAG TPA: TIGR03032 family protein [Gemmataceae bacterium]|nr:TIGR03032 family protein [Gemmataceae bacterium]
MGLAVQGNRLAIGTALEVCEFHNVPAVARKLEPAGTHDACFLPRCGHATGEVLIHEMAWVRSRSQGSGVRGQEAEPELWFVNTRFSCLCTLDGVHSFVPRWRPPFITALAPEDRCHLNGLGVVNGQVRYVTALGATDAVGGWRAGKKNGGILMEVPSGAVLLRGLSMPHSPRWHQGKLRLLESGTGTIGSVDLAAGRYEPIAELPGFTRGLDFYGNLAFLGLSQVRESAVFSGIPLTERLSERTCGVWVVDVTTGRTVAFLKFEDAVQEIFAVQVLPQVRFPDLINDDSRILSDSFVLPDDALSQLPASLRAPHPTPSPGGRG